MPERISIEELRPLGERHGERHGERDQAERARARRGFQGARVLSADLRLEPRDAGGILDLALDGLLARFWPCVGLALLFWLPFGQIRELFGLAGLDELSASVLVTGWNLLGILPQAATAAVVSSLVGDALTQRGTTPVHGLGRGLRCIPGVFAVQVITQLLTLPLAVLCLVPYFLAQWLTFAAVPIYVLEEDLLLTAAERRHARQNPLAFVAASWRRVTRSIGRSLRLSSGSGTLGRWVLVAVIGLLLFSGLLELGGSALNYPEAREYLRAELGFDGNAAQFLLAAGGTLFAALASAARAALMTAFYVDLCVRREGLDLEHDLRRIERARPVPGVVGR